MSHSRFMRTVRIWKIAVRPFAYTASILPVCLGAVIARHEGADIHWPLFALTLFGVLLFHTSANLLNDLFDFSRGLDTEVHPFSGALVRGLLSQFEIFIGAILCLGTGVCVGLFLVYCAGWQVLALGLIGTFCALAYTTPGPCLKYKALGDAAIMVAFGILPTIGTYWVQAMKYSWSPVLWGLSLALLTIGILHSNNWRDINSDSEKECLTFAGLMGDKLSEIYYFGLIILPFIIISILYATGHIYSWPCRAPYTVFGIVFALPLGVRCLMVAKKQKAESFRQLDGMSAQLHMAFGSLLIIGFIAESWI